MWSFIYMPSGPSPSALGCTFSLLVPRWARKTYGRDMTIEWEWPSAWSNYSYRLLCMFVNDWFWHVRMCNICITRGPYLDFESYGLTGFFAILIWHWSLLLDLSEHAPGEGIVFYSQLYDHKPKNVSIILWLRHASPPPSLSSSCRDNSTWFCKKLDVIRTNKRIIFNLYLVTFQI